MDLTLTAPAAAKIASTDPAASLSLRLLWVDEANGDEVYGLSPVPLDPLG